MTAVFRSPAAGMPTWPQPDPAQAQGPPLPGNLPVTVEERWGDWARIRCDNGWEAWVDGRVLAAGGAPTATGPLDHSPLKIGSVAVSMPLVGAAAALIGGLVLAWISPPGGGKGVGAGKLPIKFLLDPKIASTGGPKIMWLVVALAGAGAYLTLQPVSRQLRKACGWGLVLISTMFLTNVQRLLSLQKAGGFQAGSVFANLGFGVYVTAVGGVLIAVGKGQES
jgi:hypothetical protein